MKLKYFVLPVLSVVALGAIVGFAKPMTDPVPPSQPACPNCATAPVTSYWNYTATTPEDANGDPIYDDTLIGAYECPDNKNQIVFKEFWSFNCLGNLTQWVCRRSQNGCTQDVIAEPGCPACQTGVGD